MSGDVERLAEAICHWSEEPSPNEPFPCDACWAVAAGMVDSLEWQAWLAAHDAEVAARALQEAADAWTRGEWSDVMLPKPTPPAVAVIAYANRIGDWLRARADRVAGHAQEDE